jgi:hypothetical protein
MVIREQRSGRHRRSGAPYRNPDVMISEREPDHHHLSDALHQCSHVVSNEQGSLHFTQQVRGARKVGFV